MYYDKILVSVDSLYVGDIFDYYNKRIKNQFTPNLNVENTFRILHRQLISLKPDMVFTVQNISGFFYIKENRLFVLWGVDPYGDFIVNTIDEFTEKEKEKNFDSIIFYYKPRMKWIKVCC